MRTNTAKAKMAEGKVVFGAIISRHAPDLVELFGAIGYDFVMIDCEHGPMSLDEVEHMVRAAEVFGITPITRIPNHEDSTILRFLDRGVQGIIVPHINTRKAAEAVATAARRRAFAMQVRQQRGRERPGQLFARTGAPRPAQRCGSAQPIGRGSRDRAIQSRSRRFSVGVGCTARPLRKRRSARTKSDVCHHQSGWTVSRLGRRLESGANRSHEQVDTVNLAALRLD